MKKQHATTADAAQVDLRALTERAQSEPGLAQLLSLLEQVRTAEKAIQDVAPGSDFPSGGAFSHTF